jgi:hypothetical protein
MVLAFSAMAFAANQVTLKTTVPNIPKSTCYQAGTDTMEMDNGTAMQEGDVIQFTLNNKVTFCKSINMFLRIAGAAGTLDLAATDTAPVTGTNGLGTVTAIDGTREWGFLVRATAGAQSATLTLRVKGNAGAITPNFIEPIAGRTMVFTGADATARMITKLFDGKVASSAGNSMFLKQAATPVANVYDTLIASKDNALCIDTLTQDYQLELVSNFPESIPMIPATKLNFSGDYEIAHIMSSSASLFTCKGAATGRIMIGTSGQSSSNCSAFDFELGTNYCATANTFNRFILQSTLPFDLGNYIVTMEILKNGNAGANGVYWSSTAPTVGSSNASTTFCAAPAPAGATTLGGLTYTLADGTAATPVAPVANTCTGVAAAAKATKLVSADQNIGLQAGDTFLYINFPQFNYNLAEVNSGDVVSVKVTLSKATCGAIGNWTIPVGTFGCAAVSSTGACLYPYFTDLGAGDFWNGIVVVNTSATAGNALLTAHVKDGSTATATVAVPANSMYVNLLENIAWTGGTVGQPVWINVTTSDFPSNLDGFAMMANDAHDSMGYLCRK